MAQIIIKGLIGEEDIQKYDGTATTFTRANSTGGTSTLTPVGAGSSGLKFSKVLASSVVSLSANPAASGFERLSNTDAIAWRNAANNADDLLQSSGAASGNAPADMLVTSAFSGFGTPFVIPHATTSTAAASGNVRLQSTGSITWRNNANSADIAFTKTGAASGNIPADTFITGGGSGIAATFFSQGNSNDAATGIYRLQSIGSITWRNNANSGDLSLAKDTSDRLTFSGNTVQAPIYNATGTIQNIAHIVQDTVTLAAGTATVTLTGSAVFTSAASYTCVAIDETGTNAVKVTQTSGSSITFTGTGSDVIRYICIGT